ncbi:MAG: peptide-methionine (S)-S-oxide reductase MsrA [Anaerolineales bacterium]|nr:peptide-methionine (S)-S-oxide reductase MsrA [Anaerolineales bacterium]
MNQNQPKQEIATLGGGCFWCLDPIFQDVIGVEQVIAGYAGGTTPNPTYNQVCTGDTGHAEVVQVTFRPDLISYQDLLKLFFSVHDPTTLNRQGADSGTQYRSIILYHSQEQKETANRIIRELDQSGVWKNPIVTRVEPFTVFYPAEEYHQGYFANNPNAGYCQFVIAPKVAKFRKNFVARLRT